MATAPVCHVSPPLTITQPVAPRLPSIPTPNNTIEGLLATVMALKQLVEMLAGMIRNEEMMFMDALGRLQSRQGPNRQGGQQQDKKAKIGRWNEVRARRVTQQVKVTNPNDPEQFVVVDRIQALIMQDNVTNEQWIWNL